MSEIQNTTMYQAVEALDTVCEDYEDLLRLQHELKGSCHSGSDEEALGEIIIDEKQQLETRSQYALRRVSEAMQGDSISYTSSELMTALQVYREETDETLTDRRIQHRDALIGRAVLFAITDGAPSYFFTKTTEEPTKLVSRNVAGRGDQGLQLVRYDVDPESGDIIIDVGDSRAFEGPAKSEKVIGTYRVIALEDDEDGRRIAIFCEPERIRSRVVSVEDKPRHYGMSLTETREQFGDGYTVVDKTDHDDGSIEYKMCASYLKVAIEDTDAWRLSEDGQTLELFIPEGRYNYWEAMEENLFFGPGSSSESRQIALAATGATMEHITDTYRPAKGANPRPIQVAKTQ